MKWEVHFTILPSLQAPMCICRAIKTHFLGASPWCHKEGWAHLSFAFIYRASLAPKQDTRQQAMFLCRDCCALRTAAPCSSSAEAPMRSCHLVVIPAFSRARFHCQCLFSGHHQCAQQSKTRRKRCGSPLHPSCTAQHRSKLNFLIRPGSGL